MTWTVLVWEVSFPILVLNRWTRFVALLIGVGFHLGIFASMELGCFVPYTLCIYLAFLPWERWLGKGAASTNVDTYANCTTTAATATWRPEKRIPRSC